MVNDQGKEHLDFSKQKTSRVHNLHKNNNISSLLLTVWIDLH